MCCLAGEMHENEQLAAFGVRLGGLAWEMSWYLQIGRHRLMESLWGVQREIFIAFYFGGVNQAVWWKRAEGAEARGSRLSPGRLQSAALARANMWVCYLLPSLYFSFDFISRRDDWCLGSGIVFDSETRCMFSYYSLNRRQNRIKPHVPRRCLPAPWTTHIPFFEKKKKKNNKKSSVSSVRITADVPLNKTCEDLLGVFFRRTARVVLLEERPFLIMHAFQNEGVKLKWAPNGCH